MTVIEGIPITTQPPQRPVNLAAVNPASVNDQPAGTKIADIVHPEYAAMIDDWELWRLTYKGGQDFIEQYLKKFSKREKLPIFKLRKEVTPIPAFAKAAINDIKNAIYQRTTDITRQGGPANYSDACNGKNGGVDLAAGTMNWFIGNQIIPELLVMKKVGTFVDMPPLPGVTIADKGNKHPYLYRYTAEHIRSWSKYPNGEFSSVLLRQFDSIIDRRTRTPSGLATIFKLFFIEDNKLNYQVFNADSKQIAAGFLPLKKIPFIVFEISDSLLSDVARHQIALMNMESSDIAYSLLANFPLYIEQVDPNSSNSHLKKAQAQATDCEIQEENDEEAIDVGTATGRQYSKNLNAPAFINPSPEPLQASMAKQEALKEDIRLLVNLSLSNVKPQMASAESKTIDQHGLESGLSYIGLELEHGERKIAEFWSIYEGVSEVATITYPKRYSLKSDQERQEEAKRLAEQLHRIPSLKYKKLLLKQIVTIMIGDRISNTDLNDIFGEIDSATIIISDIDELVNLVKEGLITKQSASKALNLPENEVNQANQEHADRLKRIAVSQSLGVAANLPNPADRGVKDLA